MPAKNFRDPRKGKFPSIDELLDKVTQLWGQEGEPVGDTLFRKWIEERAGLAEMAVQLGITLARLRVLMGIYEIHEPSTLSKKKLEARVIDLLVVDAWDKFDIACQLGVPRKTVEEIIERNNLQEYDLAVPRDEGTEWTDDEETETPVESDGAATAST